MVQKTGNFSKMTMPEPPSTLRAPLEHPLLPNHLNGDAPLIREHHPENLRLSAIWQFFGRIPRQGLQPQYRCLQVGCGKIAAGVPQRMIEHLLNECPGVNREGSLHRSEIESSIDLMVENKKFKVDQHSSDQLQKSGSHMSIKSRNSYSKSLNGLSSTPRSVSKRPRSSKANSEIFSSNPAADLALVRWMMATQQTDPIVDCPEFVQFCQALQPGYVLPSIPERLGNLRQAVENEIAAGVRELLADTAHVTLVSQGWQDPTGTVTHYLQDAAKDISIRVGTDKIIEPRSPSSIVSHFEHLVMNALPPLVPDGEPLKVLVAYIVDCPLNFYAPVRKELEDKYPGLIILPNFSSMLSSIVGQHLSSVHNKLILAQILDLSYLVRQNLTVRMMLEAHAQQPIHIDLPNIGCWPSVYITISQILGLKNLLQAQQMEWDSPISSKFQFLQDPVFWTQLESLQSALRGPSLAATIIAREHTTLADCLYAWCLIRASGQALIDELWKGLGHPAYFLSGFLHPRFQRMLTPLLRTRIPSLALGMSSNLYPSFLRELAQYSAREGTFRMATFPCDHVDTWWTFFTDATPHLVRFSRRLLSIPVGYLSWNCPGILPDPLGWVRLGGVLRLRSFILESNLACFPPHPDLELVPMGPQLDRFHVSIPPIPSLNLETDSLPDSVYLDKLDQLVPLSSVLEDHPFTLAPPSSP